MPYADEDGGSLCPGFIPASGVSFHPLAEGSYHACVSRKSPLAASRELSLKTLLQYPIVLGASDEGNATPLHYLLNRYGTPDIVLSAGSVSLWNHAIANGMGVGFLHDIFLEGEAPARAIWTAFHSSRSRNASWRSRAICSLGSRAASSGN